MFLDPEDPEVRAAGARATASRDDWIEAARRSPVYDLAMRWGVALPLHPEFRTLPMVWYVPPLSPVVSTLETDGYEADPDDVFGAIDHLRIPLEYLANLLTAGDVEVIRGVLHRLAAMRAYMRKREVLGELDERAARPRRADRPRARAHVPAAGDRQLRGPLRDPAGARRARRAADGASRAPAAWTSRAARATAARWTRGPDTSSPVVPYDGESFHLLDILKRDERRGA